VKPSTRIATKNISKTSCFWNKKAETIDLLILLYMRLLKIALKYEDGSGFPNILSHKVVDTATGYASKVPNR